MTTENSEITLSKKEKNKLLKKEAKAAKIQTKENVCEEIKVADQSSHLYGEKALNKSECMGLTIYEHIGDINVNMKDKSVYVQGYLHHVRKTGKQVFLVVRQSMATLQCIAYTSDQISAQMIKFISNIPRESNIEIKGIVTVVEKPVESCTQSLVELQIQEIYIISKCKPRLNMQIEDAMRPDTGDESLVKVNLDTRLDNRTLDLRTPTNQAIFRIQSGVCMAFQDYLRDKGFVKIKVPNIIPAASEGGANVFEVNYFGEKAYLAQSPQLYKQMAICGGFDKVFIEGSVFRAENSNTHRHLTEFSGLDIEMSFHHHYYEVLDVITETLISIFDTLESKFSNEISVVRKQYLTEPFEYISPALVLPFSEGVDMLRRAGIEMGEYEDLTTTNEKFLGNLVKKKYGTDFFVLDKFPLAVRPFYTMPDPTNENYSNSYDMFMRGEEILSGAQRIHEPSMLRESAIKHGVKLDTIKDYLESFELGCPPHAGGGIGLERVVMLYLGLGNIRNASMFPRDPKRIHP